MANPIATISVTLSDLQGDSPVELLSNVIFCTAMQQLTRFQLT